MWSFQIVSVRFWFRFSKKLSPNKVRFSCYFLNGGTPPDDYIDAYIKRKLYIKLSRVNGYWVKQKHTKSWIVIPRSCGKFTAVCRLAAYKIFTRKMLLNNSRRKLVTSFSLRLMCTGIYSMRTSELCMCVRDCGVAAGKYECESISYDAQKKISLFYLNAAEQVGRSMPKWRKNTRFNRHVVRLSTKTNFSRNNLYAWVWTLRWIFDEYFGNAWACVRVALLYF